MRFKKTYSFALWSSIYLTLSSVSIAALLYFFLFEKQELIALVAFIILIFSLSFFIIQYRAERFIYKRIKKIYNDVSILDVDDFNRQSATTDIETLSKSVQK